jgi:succinoglycan biosynthesis transport protein ExoP
MQPTEGYTVPRRTLDVEDYIDILRRHKGWIFGPFLFTLVASVVGGYTWPDTYISSGIIKVERQQVPENLVQSTITQDMIDRINSMQESVLSRSKLTEIITTYNLYLKERARLPLDDVIETMRGKVAIEPLGQGAGKNVPAFRVSFSYPDRHLAQKVVQELMSRFMDENFRNQSNQTFQTTDFLKSEQDKAQKELDAIEDRLAAYKVENNGRLPEQVTNNIQKLTSLESSATNFSTQISRYQAEKIGLESQLATETRRDTVLNNLKTDPAIVAQQQPQKSQKTYQAELEVEKFADKLRQLRLQYKDNYPLVKAAQEDLNAAQSRLDQSQKEDQMEFAKRNEIIPGKQGQIQTVASVKESLDRDATVSSLQSRIAAAQTQIDELDVQLKNTNLQIRQLQGRLDSVPTSEKEYEDLKREQAIKQEEYAQMTKNLAKANITQTMEDRKEGEHLESLDPANLPESPASPNHPFVIGMGAGLGLILGIAIAGAREMKDTSLKNLKDVRAYTQMAILGSIPLLENDFVVRRRRRLAWLGWTTACLAAVVLMSGSVLYYISTKQ